MTIQDFAQLVPGLPGLSHVEKIRHFAWFLLTQKNQERFAVSDIRNCYESLDFALPGNLNRLVQHMAEKKPPELLKDSRGYRLEVRQKELLDKYGDRPETVAVASALQSLPGRISDDAERLFLTEALNCFRVRAFRAAIVMTWNLAFDHIVSWVVSNHLTTFNAAIVRKYPKRVGVAMTKKEDFADEFTEFETIEVCSVAGIIDGNTKKILNEKLTRRNMAAHPSLVEIRLQQAEDVITDLVHNVILKIT